MKKIASFIFLLTLLSCDNETANNGSEPIIGEVVFSKTFGGSLDEKINGVVATPDGGCIVIGDTNSSDGDVFKEHEKNEIWIIKLDSNGEKVWSRTIGGSDNDFGYSIIATYDGNFAIAGYSASSDGDVPGNIGMHDFFIAKINGDGALLWSKNYGFMSHDHAHKIIQTRDGGFFVAGFADYTGIEDTGQTGDNGEGHSMKAAAPMHGVGEYFGIRLDADGNFKWYRYFGGSQNDRVNDIVEAEDGGLIMVGSSESSNFDVMHNRGSYDFWVVKLDANGKLHWKENYGGSGIDQANSICKTGNNSYLIAGRTNSTDGDVSKAIGNFDAWVIHINDHGHLMWNKTFGGSEFDVATTIKKINNGHFVVTGNTRSSFGTQTNKGENDFWTFEIDNKANSSLYWQKTFGGTKIDMATDFFQTASGELVIIGESQSNDLDVVHNKGGNDLFVLKLK